MEIKDFNIYNDNENSDVHLNVFEQIQDGIILKFIMKSEEKFVPSPIRVEWKLPVGNIVSIWTPLAGFSKFIEPDWRPTKCKSKTAGGAPVFSCVDHDGSNACTIAISDSKTSTEITVGVSEEEGALVCNAVFFTSYISPIDYYEAFIYIDLKKYPWTEAVKGVNAWWENKIDCQKAYVPEAAYMPVNSSWYSFHQRLDTKRLIEECKLSRELGMKTLIIDDGWQTTDNNRGYQYCGDWELAPEKIPSMKALTDEVHKLDMKVMLWFSVPFVGKYSKAYDEFKNMALKEQDGVLILDLRYRKVREYLVSVYAKAVKEYGLDGLKLDFIGHFTLSSSSPAVNERMDIYCIEDALEELLR